jgi:hypothetical protein
VSFCDVYIGADEEGEKFSWEPTDDAYRILNLPRRIGPFFPKAMHLPGHGLWSLVLGRMKSGYYPGVQVDWGGWAAPVTLSTIRNLMDEVFPAGYSYRAPARFPDMYAHMEAELREFRAFLDALEDKPYILVAVET